MRLVVDLELVRGPACTKGSMMPFRESLGGGFQEQLNLV